MLEIVMPAGAFGAYEGEDAVASMLRRIAVAVSSDSQEWAEKYGTEFDNETFAMHPFCSCDQDACPWCGASCECPPSAFHHLVDGEEVGGWEEWMDFYCQYVYGVPYKQYKAMPFNERYSESEEYLLRSSEANSRRSMRYDPVCNFCTKGHGIEQGGIPGRAAPNFWHKPSGFRVWWYKYIGRSQVTDPIEVAADDLAAVEASCLVSLEVA